MCLANNKRLHLIFSNYFNNDILKFLVYIVFPLEIQNPGEKLLLLYIAILILFSFMLYSHLIIVQSVS